MYIHTVYWRLSCVVSAGNKKCDYCTCPWYTVSALLTYSIRLIPTAVRSLRPLAGPTTTAVERLCSTMWGRKNMVIGRIRDLMIAKVDVIKDMKTTFHPRLHHDRTVGFLNGMNRLIVSLSRARCTVCATQ